MILLSLVSAGAACPDPDTVLEALEESLQLVELDRAEASLADFERAHACSWVEPLELARFWAAEGAYWHYRKNESRAMGAFAASRAIADEGFEQPYGSKVEAVWEAAPPPEGTGTLMVEPVPTGFALRVDGRTAASRSELSPGVHSVQVGPHEAPVFAELRLVVADTMNTVNTDLEEGPPPPKPRPVEPEPEPVVEAPRGKKKRSPALLVASGALAVGSGTLAIAAVSEQRGMANADDLETLDRARSRQLAYGYSSYALAGLSAVGLGVHFLL